MKSRIELQNEIIEELLNQIKYLRKELEATKKLPGKSYVIPAPMPKLSPSEIPEEIKPDDSKFEMPIYSEDYHKAMILLDDIVKAVGDKEFGRLNAHGEALEHLTKDSKQCRIAINALDATVRLIANNYINITELSKEVDDCKNAIKLYFTEKEKR